MKNKIEIGVKQIFHLPRRIQPGLHDRSQKTSPIDIFE